MEMGMTDRSNTPRELARRMKQAMSHRAIAAYHVARSTRQAVMAERQRFVEAAEHYRKLAELEEEVAGMRPKPPRRVYNDLCFKGTLTGFRARRVVSFALW